VNEAKQFFSKKPASMGFSFFGWDFSGKKTALTYLLDK